MDASAILNSYNEPAILIDLELRIQAANRAYRKLYGEVRPYGKRHCYEISHAFTVPCDQEGESCPIEACLNSGTPQRVMHVHHTPRGQEHVAVEIRPILDDSGTVKHFLEIIHPVQMASATPAAVGLVGNSPTFNRMLEQLRRVTKSRIPVLLQGESGTGKEIVARAIHDGSDRSGMPFVPVECSGLTETLFESELFGHERGAFTGAVLNKIGLVEAAHKGTLFLDEIGEIPLSLQVKLLRLLETQTYRKVGGIDSKNSDFRLICATHRNLNTMLEREEFRLDLYYRICSFPVNIPPLRERQEDLPLLVNSLLQRMDGGQKLSMSREAMQLLSGHVFPGNIREMFNILERASLLVDGKIILPEHLPETVHRVQQDQQNEMFSFTKVIPLLELEQHYLNYVMRCFPMDRNALASKLGVSKRTLFRKLQEAKQTSCSARSEEIYP